MIANPNGNFSREVLAWYQKTLEHFGGEKNIKSQTTADVLCPEHPDTNPSLGVDLREDNGSGPKIVLNCRSGGCDHQAILEAVGLTLGDLFFRNGSSKKKKDPEVYGCTLAQYAEAKRLPVAFLQNDYNRLRDTKKYVKEAGGKVDAVEIPYATREGRSTQSRYRVSLSAEKRVISEYKVPTMLYCLHRMDEVLKAGYALLLEGESDCHTAWFHGIPAIGIPGAGTWKPEWDEDVADIPKLYFVVEDAAGEKMWKKLSDREAFDGRLRRLG
jgi:hypothetical protein